MNTVRMIKGRLHAFCFFYCMTFLCFSIVFSAPRAHALTVQEAYRSALQSRETVAASKLNEESSKAEKRSVRALVLPTVTVISETQWIDAVSLGGDTSRFGESRQHEARISLTQPLFQGGSEYFGLKIASTNIEIAQMRRRQVELDLFGEVASVFYEILLIQQEIENLSEQESLLKERVQALSKRAAIGRSKPSDALTAKSQLARNIAAIAQSESKLIGAIERFSFVTGVSVPGKLADSYQSVGLDTDRNWQRLLEDSPLITQIQLELDNAQRARRSSQGSYLPTVDVTGNYFLDRAGILEDSKWNVTLLAQWEIFSGLGTNADVTLQELEKRRLELELSETLRRNKTEITALQKLIETRKRTLEKLKLAVDLAKESYTQLQDEYRRGLITNLEVLAALDDYHQVKTSYDIERLTLRLEWIRLHLLAGEIP